MERGKLCVIFTVEKVVISASRNSIPLGERVTKWKSGEELPSPSGFSSSLVTMFPTVSQKGQIFLGPLFVVNVFIKTLFIICIWSKGIIQWTRTKAPFNDDSSNFSSLVAFKSRFLQAFFLPCAPGVNAVYHVKVILCNVSWSFKGFCAFKQKALEYLMGKTVAKCFFF